jgi:hypothetical protein
MNKTVRNYLIELARKKTNQVVTYQKLCDDCNLKLDMENQYHRKVIGEILGDISTFEHQNERPLISSLVLRKGDDYEGDGFYKLAERLGFGNWKKLKKEGVFEIFQMKESINKWTDESFYIKNK